MSKFIRNIALFIAGLPLATTRAADVPTPDAPRYTDLDNAVSLRPLNFDMDNLFASHRSHSSHRWHSSHRSHYSGSGSGSSYVPSSSYVTPSTSSSSLPSSSATPSTSSYVADDVESRPTLSVDEKLRLQVIRVQIRLNSLQLYDGQIDGVFGEETKDALKLFQRVKELPATGLMSTPTLNALGISAVK
jgi:His-Xaa-Ser repeat protein HxsA